MSQGEIVESGPARQVMGDPQQDYTRRLVAAAPSIASARVGAEGDHEDARGARGGRSAGGPRGPRTRSCCAPTTWSRPSACAAAGSGSPAVDHVSFATLAGTTTAVVGESGSGKTTLARMVLGLETPTAGEVCVDGEAVANGPPGRVAGPYAGPCSRSSRTPYASLNPMFTVEHIIDEPLRVFRTGDRAARRGPGGRTAGPRRAADHPRPAPPQRALGRSATAGGDRPRARPRPATGDLRRGGLRARRAGPGPDPAAARGPAAARPRAVLSVHHPRTWPWCGWWPTRSWSCRTGRVVESGPVEKVFDAPACDYTRRAAGPPIPGSAFLG